MDRRQFFKSVAATVAVGAVAVVAPAVSQGRPKGVVRGNRSKHIVVAGGWPTEGVRWPIHDERLYKLVAERRKLAQTELGDAFEKAWDRAWIRR